MSISKRFLLEAAGLSLAVVFIGTGFVMASRSRILSETVIESQDRVLQQEQEYNVVKYDGYPINGSIALNYLKSVIADYGIPVTIIKGSVEIVITSSEQFASLRNIDSDNYINPMKDYQCEVHRDVNDMISGVDLTEVP